MAYYLDTSALVKLVVDEAESDALRAWFGESDRGPVSCDLTRTELVRAVRRVAPDALADTRALLDSIGLLELASSTFAAAGRVDPTVLRSLDAIHVAAALELGDDLEGLVAYDRRLLEAAEANGIPVVTPGRSAPA